MESDPRTTRMGSDRAVYVISVAAELTGVHPQTLRIYERKGLLDPARTLGGSRRYSERDIALLQRIQDLTNAGLNLEGVKRVLELEAEVARLRSELDQTRRQAVEEVQRTHRQYRRDLVPIDNSPQKWLPMSPQARSPQARPPQAPTRASGRAGAADTGPGQLDPRQPEPGTMPRGGPQFQSQTPHRRNRGA
jgi:MerR family transcriptional regulator/heat shock protein HspR